MEEGDGGAVGDSAQSPSSTGGGKTGLVPVAIGFDDDKAGCIATGRQVAKIDRSWLVWGFLQFALDQPRRFANIPNLLHFFRRQLKSKLLFQRKYEVQMLSGIPGLDHFGRRLSHDSMHGNTEKIGCYASNLVENG